MAGILPLGEDLAAVVAVGAGVGDPGQVVGAEAETAGGAANLVVGGDVREVVDVTADGPVAGLAQDPRGHLALTFGIPVVQYVGGHGSLSFVSVDPSWVWT